MRVAIARRIPGRSVHTGLWFTVPRGMRRNSGRCSRGMTNSQASASQGRLFILWEQWNGRRSREMHSQKGYMTQVSGLRKGKSLLSSVACGVWSQKTRAQKSASEPAWLRGCGAPSGLAAGGPRRPQSPAWRTGSCTEGCSLVLPRIVGSCVVSRTPRVGSLSVLRANPEHRSQPAPAPLTGAMSCPISSEACPGGSASPSASRPNCVQKEGSRL